MLSSSARADMRVSGTYWPPNGPKRPRASGRVVTGEGLFLCLFVDGSRRVLGFSRRLLRGGRGGLGSRGAFLQLGLDTAKVTVQPAGDNARQLEDGEQQRERGRDAYSLNTLDEANAAILPLDEKMVAEMEDVPLRLERQLLAGDKLRHRDLGREVAPQLVTNGLEGAPLSDWSVRRALDLDGNVRPLWMAGEVRDVGEHGLRGDIYLDAALDHRHRGLLPEWGVWWRILYPVRLARTLGDLDEGANLGDVLHAVGLDAGGDVDGPGVDGAHGAGHVVGPEAAGEHYRLLGRHLRRDRPVQGDAGAAVRPLDVGIQQEEGAAVHLRQHLGGSLALADLQALQHRPLDEAADLPGLGAGELYEVQAALPRDAVDRVGVLVGEDADQQRTARAQPLLPPFA